MKFLLSGFIAGALAGLIFFQGQNASELIASNYIDIASVNSVNKGAKKNGTFNIPLEKDEFVFLADRGGEITEKVDRKGSLIEFSGNGKYYIKYGKVGSQIEFWISPGERYWKMKSREKPLLSQDGELIFLINGDQSSIRMVDKNGNEIGSRRISGRLCTVVEFSFPGNYGSCGFVDGSYYFVNDTGFIINSGRAPVGNMIKSIGVSANGMFGVIHFGNADKDKLRIIDIKNNKIEEVGLLNVHNVKTSMHVSNDGRILFFDYDNLLFADSDGRIISILEVPEKRPGHSSVTKGNGFYAITYVKTSGEPFFIVLNERGEVFYKKNFHRESFLHSKSEDGFILLRGSDSLFSYNFYPSED